MNLRSSGYVPLDAIATMPSTRVLRTLAFRGWVDSDDVYESLDVDAANPTYQSLLQAVSRLSRDGLIERHGGRYQAHAYRITDKGRRVLAERMTAESNIEFAPARPGTERFLVAEDACA